MQVDVVFAILGGIVGATIGQLGGDFISARLAKYPLYQRFQRLFGATRAPRSADTTYD